jgi:hypothetical protein
MKLAIRKTLLGGACLLAIAASVPALAHGDRDDDRGRGWGHGHGHQQKHWKERRVVHERVIVRERPVYVEQRVVRYYEPRPVYYPRDPAIVVSVDIPPLVFPLR